jgi:serine/threonine protein kinase
VTDPILFLELQKMMVLDPFKRITAADALKHPYFDEKWKEFLQECSG